MERAKKNKLWAKAYFNLTEEDRVEMDLKDRKKEEENQIVENVFMKLEEKLKKE
jgi:hypothetical protein